MHNASLFSIVGEYLDLTLDSAAAKNVLIRDWHHYADFHHGVREKLCKRAKHYHEAIYGKAKSRLA